MAKTARDYPVTYTYGYHPDYPINNGFHRGEDRSMPDGVPVVVNNTTIGKSGHSGYVTGPHLHIGRYKVSSSGVTYINPRGSGFNLKSFLGLYPKIDSWGENSTNGKYVRIRNWQGQIFVYCHLSSIASLTKGQRVK
jgi:murein DD-endopeptidase MepM/ murein hydrolase activator NlpD